MTFTSTSDLFKEEILKPFFITPNDKLIKELTTDALAYLTLNESAALFNRNSKSKAWYKNIKESAVINAEKLPYEVQSILKQTLVNSDWFRVDKGFADFYMTLLANNICEKNGFALITDNVLTSNLSNQVRSQSKRSLEAKSTINLNGKAKSKYLAQGLLINSSC